MNRKLPQREPRRRCLPPLARAASWAAPKRIEFEELDFNLGERWIPTDIYEGFCEHFFQVPVSVSYSTKMDAFGIENHGYSPLISQKYVVKGDFEVYDGMDLLHHAMLNTLPNINKDGGKENTARPSGFPTSRPGRRPTRSSPKSGRRSSNGCMRSPTISRSG